MMLNISESYISATLKHALITLRSISWNDLGGSCCDGSCENDVSAADAVAVVVIVDVVDVVNEDIVVIL